MKKNKNNNQLPPNLLGFWVKGQIKDGAIIKNKLIKPIKINMVKKSNNEDNDEDIIIKLLIRRSYKRKAKKLI